MDPSLILFLIVFLMKCSSAVVAEKAKLREGQAFSIEKMTEIALQVFRTARAGKARPAQDSRGPDGNVNDYLEQRRPFEHPNPSGVTH